LTGFVAGQRGQHFHPEAVIPGIVAEIIADELQRRILHPHPLGRKQKGSGAVLTEGFGFRLRHGSLAGVVACYAVIVASALTVLMLIGLGAVGSVKPIEPKVWILFWPA